MRLLRPRALQSSRAWDPQTCNEIAKEGFDTAASAIEWPGQRACQVNRTFSPSEKIKRRARDVSGKMNGSLVPGGNRSYDRGSDRGSIMQSIDLRKDRRE